MVHYTRFLVIDVESIGLHGEGFAVGYAVLEKQGGITATGLFACQSHLASGTQPNHAWVQNNVCIPEFNCDTPRDVRSAFWSFWEDFRARHGSALAADCAWPVEANFLAKCIADNTLRGTSGPYPLFDVSSFLVAAGSDPLKQYPRLPSELPAHNPVADARQSARILHSCLTQLGYWSAVGA